MTCGRQSRVQWRVTMAKKKNAPEYLFWVPPFAICVMMTVMKRYMYLKQIIITKINIGITIV